MKVLKLNNLIYRLWLRISIRRRYQFILLFILMFIGSIVEMVSIGAVVPFFGALINPDNIFEYSITKQIMLPLGIITPKQLTLALTIIFVFLSICAGIMRLLLLWSTTHLSFAAGADISIEIYRRTLHQPYSVHCERNSSEVISSISQKTNTVIYGIILPVMTLINSCTMLSAVLFILILMQPYIAIYTFFILLALYLAIIFVSKRKLERDSQYISQDTTKVIKLLQEGLGSIRDILIDNNQDLYCDLFQKADLRLRKAQGDSVFISSAPRSIIEAAGLSIIAIICLLESQQIGGIAVVMPLLAALGVSAQRLLPILQQGYSAWIIIQSSKVSLRDILELLEQEILVYSDRLTKQSIKFEKSLNLIQVSFQYRSNSPSVLNKIDLSIKKGSRVGLVGVTGGGKSTLIDIIMGLLKPTKGSLEVDGNKIDDSNLYLWQKLIAHVPQVIYLTDATIEENIAFGQSKETIDHVRVVEVARKAKIHDAISILPDGYKTLVGEGGVRLSGGQRQRIGIARALYKNAKVIIFDEATSALDNETEKSIMHEVEGLSQDLTLIIIAHRLSTLKICNEIYEVSNGNVMRNYNI